MTKILEVKQGIWIDEQLLKSMGIGEQCQVVVQPGEIRIIPLAVSTEPESRADEQSDVIVEAWQVFRALGRNAPRGKLAHTSINHDRYLYGNQ